MLTKFINDAREKGIIDVPDNREFLFEEITPRRRSDSKRQSASVERMWRSYKETRDPQLRNRLIMSYLPLVKYISDRLHTFFGTSVRVTPSRTFANGKKGKGSIEIQPCRFDKFVNAGDAVH